MGDKNHPYHIVDPSPWPISTAGAALFVAAAILATLHTLPYAIYALAISIVLLLWCMGRWWIDIIKEGLIQNQHTPQVKYGLKIGVILFIVSEVMFFGVFFASIFKNKLFPLKGLIDQVWAEKIIDWVPSSFQEFDPWNIPFLNTLILLLSTTTLAWTEHSLRENNTKDLLRGLKYTIILGLTFTGLQIFEYAHAPFKINEGIITSDFYIATGFHGAHVIIGTIFLFVAYVRARLGHFDVVGQNYLGFEFAVWYWHFVDAVWVLLFIFLYLW